VAEAQASCAYRGRLCRELGCGGNCAKPRASHLFKPLFLYYFVCQPSIFSTLELMQNTSVLSNSENVSRLCLHVQFSCTPSGVKFNTRLSLHRHRKPNTIRVYPMGLVHHPQSSRLGLSIFNLDPSHIRRSKRPRLASQSHHGPSKSG
jgi:hypothetical protein